MNVPEAPLPAIPGAARRLVEVQATDVGPLRLHVSELGQGDPVVLLHGWPQHAGCWRKVAPRLAERHRVICPDLRGFGASDTPGRGYDSSTFAKDTVALLDALGLERARLLGHDWGGFAGFLLALRQPRRIAAFVACNTPLPWVRLTPRVADQLWRTWYAFVLAGPLGGAVLGRRRDLIARGVARGADGISEEEAEQYMRSLGQPARIRATQLLYRAYLRSLVRVGGGGRPRRDRRLTVPTHLLMGAGDAFVSKELVAGDHSEHADDLTIEVVEGCGHFTPEDRPELVVERAVELFEGVRQAG
jgi:pimeloyl-ACP methyl ester carboxylesterase